MVEQLLAPELDYEDNIDYEKRVVWIDGEVDESLLEVVRAMLEWNQEDRNLDPNERRPVTIFFFSPGGYLDEAYSLIDAIALSKTPVHGVNVGLCQSAAAFIFISCHQRFTFPHGRFLFHQGSGGFKGHFNQLRAQMEDYNSRVGGLTDLILQRTQYSAQEVTRNIETEWYIRAEEALEKGVCDKIVDDLDLLLPEEEYEEE